MSNKNASIVNRRVRNKLELNNTIAVSQIPKAKVSIIPVNDLSTNVKLMASVLGITILLATAIIFICTLRLKGKDNITERLHTIEGQHTFCTSYYNFFTS